jgi:hypothetical protein
MNASLAPSTEGGLPILTTPSAPRARRGRPLKHGDRALSAKERMKLMRLRRTVKRGAKSKRVRWQHLSKAVAYQLQLDRQAARDRRHDKYLTQLIEKAVASGRETLPATDRWGELLSDAPSGLGLTVSIHSEEVDNIMNKSPRVAPSGHGPADNGSSYEGDDNYIKKNFHDKSELACFVKNCLRLPWRVREVDGQEVFCCELHQPIS